MVVVFSAFGLSSIVIIKQIGFRPGLGHPHRRHVGPCPRGAFTMRLMGSWNWWSPSWLPQPARHAAATSTLLLGDVNHVLAVLERHRDGHAEVSPSACMLATGQATPRGFVRRQPVQRPGPAPTVGTSGCTCTRRRSRGRPGRISRVAMREKSRADGRGGRSSRRRTLRGQGGPHGQWLRPHDRARCNTHRRPPHMGRDQVPGHATCLPVEAAYSQSVDDGRVGLHHGKRVLSVQLGGSDGLGHPRILKHRRAVGTAHEQGRHIVHEGARSAGQGTATSAPRSVFKGTSRSMPPESKASTKGIMASR